MWFLKSQSKDKSFLLPEKDLEEQPEVASAGQDFVVRALRGFGAGSGSQGRDLAWEVLPRRADARAEAGIGERWPAGMGQLSAGAMGSDDEFGFSFSTLVSLESSNVCCLVFATAYISGRWALKGGTGMFGQS